MIGKAMEQPRTPAAGTDAGASAEPGQPVRDLPSLINEYQTPLLRYVRRLIHRSEDAEDIVQEAFMRLHRTAERDGWDSIQSTASWLFRVSHNLSMDMRRKRQRRGKARDRVVADSQATQQHNTPPDAVEHMVSVESTRRALAELDNLPEDQQQVVRLKVIDGLTLREVGDVLNLSIGNVHYRLNRGLAELARRLKETGDI